MQKSAVVLVMTLALMSIGGTGWGASTRTSRRSYSMPQGTIISEGGAQWDSGVEAHRFKVRPGEKAVSLSVDDLGGQPVRVHVYLDANGDGQRETIAFCSQTSEPLPVRFGRSFDVRVLAGVCQNGRPSLVTSGTITATFHR